MCHRFAPVALDELQEALASWRFGGRAAFRGRDRVPDAYPGGSVPVAVRSYDTGLQAAVLTWGFVRPKPASRSMRTHEGQRIAGTHQGARDELVFNTRLDTAVEQARSGRGLWAEAIWHGRCLVPVRAFYEPSATETVPSPRTGKAVRRPYRFTLAGSNVFLLAGIAQDGRFSIVTTEPNRWVAPVHSRMPLVLGPGESQLWLDGDFAALADRSRVELTSEAE